MMFAVIPVARKGIKGQRNNTDWNRRYRIYRPLAENAKGNKRINQRDGHATSISVRNGACLWNLDISQSGRKWE